MDELNEVVQTPVTAVAEPNLPTAAFAAQPDNGTAKEEAAAEVEGNS